MPALCPTCRNPHEVDYGIECVPGDHAIFIRRTDTRIHCRNRCPQYRREEVAGITQGMIDRALNTAMRHQSALPGVA